MKLNKKGQIFNQLGALGIGIAALAITLVVTFLILSQAKSQLVEIDGINTSDSSTYSLGYNSTSTLQGAVDTIPGWIPLIIIASIGAILLSLVAVFRR